jgi:hypothetical protein
MVLSLASDLIGHDNVAEAVPNSSTGSASHHGSDN